MTTLETIQASWDKAAVQDAMFNIITEPGRENGGWTAEEFFAHGKAEIDAAMDRLADLDLGQQHGRALDFGCGIGRLTQALADYYDRVDGVDISWEMVNRARKHNTRGRRAKYFANSAPDLRLFPDGMFHLVYSMVVLQHMPQHLQRQYVAEFFRVLRPGGVAMFQIPDGPNSGHLGWHLSMYGVPRVTVNGWIAENDATLVDVEDLGCDSAWQNYRYTAVKG